MTAASQRSLTVQRDIDASPEELFDAWLDPESLAVWMKGADFIKASTARVDPRVGGEYRIVMQAADRAYVHSGTYRTIDRPRTLSFTWTSDATQHQPTLVTVEFRPKGAMTRIVLTHEQLPEHEIEDHRKGWTWVLELLNEHMTGAS